jgi:hypothetical protein
MIKRRSRDMFWFTLGIGFAVLGALVTVGVVAPVDFQMIAGGTLCLIVSMLAFVLDKLECIERTVASLKAKEVVAS